MGAGRLSVLFVLASSLCMLSRAFLPVSRSSRLSSHRLMSSLYLETPLIRSHPLSALVGRDVYLKLDLLQPSGSFKDRGMANLCQQFDSNARLVSSSGGNAGLAVATVGRQLGQSVEVVVPETTKPLVIEKLTNLGAKVTVHGENWNAADTLAREWVEADPDRAVYVSPYDNPLLWTGHSTLVDEIKEQLDTAPAAIVVSVGGGGLICGVLEGLERNGLHQTAVVAAETEGCSSFGQSWEKGELVRLDAITSIATSLGALEVTPVSLERSRAHVERGGSVTSVLCNDAEAVDACWKLSQDHRWLIEPACGAALAAAYSDRLRTKLLEVSGEGPIVIVVCGGSGVNVDLLKQWKETHGV